MTRLGFAGCGGKSSPGRRWAQSSDGNGSSFHCTESLESIHQNDLFKRFVHQFALSLESAWTWITLANVMAGPQQVVRERGMPGHESHSHCHWISMNVNHVREHDGRSSAGHSRTWVTARTWFTSSAAWITLPAENHVREREWLLLSSKIT